MGTNRRWEGGERRARSDLVTRTLNGEYLTVNEVSGYADLRGR